MKTTNEIFQYAGLVKRLKAFAYDYLIIFAFIVVLAGVNYGVILAGRTLGKVSPLFESIVVKDIIAFLTLILPVILYFTFQESSSRQATWGKRKVGLVVVDSNGGRLSCQKAFLRSIIKFLPWQIAHTSIYQLSVVGFENKLPISAQIGFILTYLLVGIYVISILTTKKHRTPYDLAAGSCVILEDNRKIDRIIGTV